MLLAIAVARRAIAVRSMRDILGVSVANSTAVSTGPMVAKKVVKLVSAVSIMTHREMALVSSPLRRLLTHWLRAKNSLSAGWS